MVVIISLLVFAAVECGRRGLTRIRVGRTVALASSGAILGEKGPRGHSSQRESLRTLGSITAQHWTPLLAAGLGVLAAAGGVRLVGPVGVAGGLAIAVTLPRVLQKRRIRKRQFDLERQLAEVAESTAMAVRSGFSIAQALSFAAEEAVAPMSAILLRFVQEQDLGTTFDDALRRLADELGTSDARLFTLIVSIHARSGGNLAVALDEVAGTIRHRIAVRRELRALSAQGRISGSILGALPIAFFLVLAATSQRELAPVYRSSAGLVMITSGLVMEALAFVWIRRLLRVEA